MDQRSAHDSDKAQRPQPRPTPPSGENDGAALRENAVHAPYANGDTPVLESIDMFKDWRLAGQSEDAPTPRWGVWTFLKNNLRPKSSQPSR